MIERFVAGTKTDVAALHVSESEERPDFAITGCEFISNGEAAIKIWLLKIERANFAAGIDEPQFAKIIVRNSPLTAAGRSLFLENICSVKAQAIIVHCH